MSSSSINNLGVHFLTSKQFNDKVSPSASELWFVKLPHWLNYSGGGCLGIVTQPTTSGNEINFYAWASFIVHKGKSSDGTNKNQIVYIDSDKYLQVSDSGSYCFDENGDMISGDIHYDADTNLVSVNGTPGSYTQKVQDYSYSGETVTLSEDIEILSMGGGGGATYTSYGNNWAIQMGNTVIQGYSDAFEYGEYSKTINLLVPMANTSYNTSLITGSYYQPYINYKSTTSIELYLSEAWDTVNFILLVIGEC